MRSRAALSLLLVVTGGYFLLRGPVRAWQRGTIDLNVFYSQSRAWLRGANPYDGPQLAAVFADAGGAASLNVPLSPPSTLAVLSPLALLRWPVAETAWTLINLALTAGCLVSLFAWLAPRVGALRSMLAVALALSLAPFHTAISQGQLSVAVTALVVLALGGEMGRTPLVTGIALGLATALKPQMGLMFLLMCAGRRQWPSLAWAAGVLSALSAIGVGRMAAAGVPWLASWIEVLKRFTHGGDGDPTQDTSVRALMINLHVVLHSFTDDRLLVGLFVSGLVLCLGGAAVVGLRRQEGSGTALLGYSVAAVLSLLGFYNRLYSATLLGLPLAWAMASLDERSRRKAAILTLGCVVTFVIPGAAIMSVLERQGVMESFTQTVWWRFAIFHQVYALVVLAATLVFATTRPVQKNGCASVSLQERVR